MSRKHRNLSRMSRPLHTPCTIQLFEKIRIAFKIASYFDIDACKKLNVKYTRVRLIF